MRDRFENKRLEAMIRELVRGTGIPAPSFIWITPEDMSKIVGLFPATAILSESDEEVVVVAGKLMLFALRRVWVIICMTCVPCPLTSVIV